MSFRGRMDELLLFRCFELALSAVDRLFDHTCDSPQSEFLLRLRHRADEVIAPLGAWAAAGTGPPPIRRAAPLLLAQTRPLILRFALLSRARSLDLSALQAQ